ncbi:MAG: hypothetical protein ACRDSN_03995 [Pseudonocardiaceae bacterium]
MPGIELIPHGGLRLRCLMPPGEPERASSRAGLFEEFVRLAGPVVPADLAGWLDVRSATAAPQWPQRVWRPVCAMRWTVRARR